MVTNETEQIPKISVVMSVFNSDPVLLKKSINSILNQSFLDFEFIICDDGSNISIIELLDFYARKDSRIILLKNSKNEGLPFSLNRCIGVSKALIIARMDDDDVASRFRLETEYDFLVKNQTYSFCSCDAFIINGQDVISGYIHSRQKPSAKDVCLGTQFIHPGAMMRKKDLLASGGYLSDFFTKNGRCEDYDLWNRFYFNGFLGANISKPLLCYREFDDAYLKRTRKSRIVCYRVKQKWWNNWRERGVSVSLFLRAKACLIAHLPAKSLFLFHKKKNRCKAEDLSDVSLYFEIKNSTLIL